MAETGAVTISPNSPPPLIFIYHRQKPVEVFAKVRADNSTPAESNTSDEPGEAKPPKDDKDFECEYCCKKYISYSGLKKHQRTIHGKGRGRSVCAYCGRSFIPNYLKNHETKCATIDRPRRRPTCPHENCRAFFFKKEDLLDHLRSYHKEDIEEVRKMIFNSIEEFFEWKEEEELSTFSCYTKHGGRRLGTECFYCQHDGSDKSHSNYIPKSGRKNRKGRIKTGTFCYSFMRRYTLKDGRIQVLYWPTHNHPISPDDIKHHKLSRASYQYISDQLKLHVPLGIIHEALKKKAVQENNVKEGLVSLKRLQSMRSRTWRFAPYYDLPNVNSFVEVLSSLENSPVIFYAKRGESEEDFILGIQSEDQREMLQRTTVMSLFIGTTFKEEKSDFEILSLLVVTEDNREYPVGHLIATYLDQESITLFLRAIGEKCPGLNVNSIIFDDISLVHGALVEVFGEDGPYFLSKWHLIEFLFGQISTIASGTVAKEMKARVLGVIEAVTEEKFLELAQEFNIRYLRDFPDFCSLFSTYVENAPLWALCYRKYSGIVDSGLYFESFKIRLFKKFQRKTVTRNMYLLELLLHFQEEYKCKREMFLRGEVDYEVINRHHSIGMDIPEKSVDATSANHWSVKEKKCGIVYHFLMRCVERCEDEHCIVKCSSCDTLCCHMYFCTCADERGICKHIHKVHSMTSESFAQPFLTPKKECVSNSPTLIAGDMDVDEAENDDYTAAVAISEDYTAGDAVDEDYSHADAAVDEDYTAANAEDEDYTADDEVVQEDYTAADVVVQEDYTAADVIVQEDYTSDDAVNEDSASQIIETTSTLKESILDCLENLKNAVQEKNVQTVTLLEIRDNLNNMLMKCCDDERLDTPKENALLLILNE